MGEMLRDRGGREGCVPSSSRSFDLAGWMAATYSTPDMYHSKIQIVNISYISYSMTFFLEGGGLLELCMQDHKSRLWLQHIKCIDVLFQYVL